MVKRENVTIKNKEFVKTYSDLEGYGVMRDDIIYEIAFDPIEFKDERIYVEVKLPEEENNNED